MDALASDILAFNQANLQTRIDYAVARKMLDADQASGAAAIEMIRAAGTAQAEALRNLPGRSGVNGLGEKVDCCG